jgi:hypothetical protein
MATTSRRRGRPVDPHALRRGLHFRLGEPEIRLLDSAARRFGLTRSDLARRVLEVFAREAVLGGVRDGVLVVQPAGE